MPRHTEARIRELCNELGALKSENEIEEILEELRAVLREHVSMARNALGEQLASLHAIETLRREES
jgi:predicted transcriptional regulator